MNTKKLGLITGAVAVTTVGAVVAFGQFSTETAKAGDFSFAADTAMADGQAITVYKSPTCGCCQSWVEHLEAHGFQAEVVNTDTLYEIKQEQGVPRQLSSCHTAIIDGYVVEGHVPAADILAYMNDPVFAEGGITVPGMPQGSPGMETGRVDDFQVVAFDESGQARVFREYAQ